MEPDFWSESGLAFPHPLFFRFNLVELVSGNSVGLSAEVFRSKKREKIYLSLDGGGAFKHNFSFKAGSKHLPMVTAGTGGNNRMAFKRKKRRSERDTEENNPLLAFGGGRIGVGTGFEGRGASGRMVLAGRAGFFNSGTKYS